MTTSAPAGLALTEYTTYCELLGQVPNPALTPLERAAAIPTWLIPELVCTEAARMRLRRWADCGRPALSRRAVARDVVVLGLARIRSMLVAAVRRTPPPVAHYLVHHTWIVGGGQGLLGWVQQAPRPPAGALQLVWLDGKLDPGGVWSVAGHEFAHAWLLATAPADQVPTLHERERAARAPARLAAKWGRPDLLATERQRQLRALRRDEIEAARLAAAWGFSGAAAEADHCAETARVVAVNEP